MQLCFAIGQYLIKPPSPVEEVQQENAKDGDENQKVYTRGNQKRKN